MKLISLSQGKRTKVSNADYRRLKKFSWYAKKPTPEIDSWYATRTERPRSGGNPKTFYMHRQIMRCPAGKEVHHKNGNTLDNRRKNLEIAPIERRH